MVTRCVERVVSRGDEVTNDYESQSCFNAKKFNLTDRRVYLPEYIQKSVFVDVFGRKHSAPTVGGNAICRLSLLPMGGWPPENGLLYVFGQADPALTCGGMMDTTDFYTSLLYSFRSHNHPFHGSIGIVMQPVDADRAAEATTMRIDSAIVIDKIPFTFKFYNGLMVRI